VRGGGGGRGGGRGDTGLLRGRGRGGGVRAGLAGGAAAFPPCARRACGLRGAGVVRRGAPGRRGGAVLRANAVGAARRLATFTGLRVQEEGGGAGRHGTGPHGDVPVLPEASQRQVLLRPGLPRPRRPPL